MKSPKHFSIYEVTTQYQQVAPLFAQFYNKRDSSHFSTLIHINYTNLKQLLAPATNSNYIPKDYCDRAQKVITEVLTGSSRSDTN